MSFDDIPAFVSRLQTSKYVIAASLVILIINYIDTFSEEYELIWKSKWGAAKVLFLFSRYIAFAEMLLTMCLYNDAEMQYDSCISFCWAVTALGACAISMAQFIIILRTYAVWGPSRRFLFGLSTFSLVCKSSGVLASFKSLIIPYQIIIVAIVSSMGDYIKTIRYGKPPVPGIIACLPVQENNDIMGIDFILVYLHETVIAGLTTYRGLKHFRHVRSPLWITLFREGIIYYFLISISTIVAVILLFRLPVDLATCLNPLQSILHSVLSCRVILHLRAANKVRDNPTVMPMESLQFAPVRQSQTVHFSETGIASTRSLVELELASMA